MSIRPQDPPVEAPSPDFSDEQLPARMGIEVTESSRERVVGTMPVAGNRQPFGLLHGGASGVLVETLGSLAAAHYTLPERFPVGLELACTHHRGATEGLLTGVATPMHVGRTTSTFEVVITDERGRRTCTGKLTCLHLDRRPGPA
ncbi:hotdog fold thioesterase [Pseudonocardia acaciae]|uniref:hotdog fold thioesterase n=1 Tax=Pseudonocardia acaciae TaxID=551276 RepID=UPI000491180E|nr:hotdog fold thioesterase [Pseudonocardia acaciae]